METDGPCEVFFTPAEIVAHIVGNPPHVITGSGPLPTPTERRRHCLRTIANRLRAEADRLEALSGEIA